MKGPKDLSPTGERDLIIDAIIDTRSAPAFKRGLGLRIFASNANGTV
jgi:hypothetical protein